MANSVSASLSTIAPSTCAPQNPLLATTNGSSSDFGAVLTQLIGIQTQPIVAGAIDVTNIGNIGALAGMTSAVANATQQVPTQQGSTQQTSSEKETASADTSGNTETPTLSAVIAAMQAAVIPIVVQPPGQQLAAASGSQTDNPAGTSDQVAPTQTFPKSGVDVALQSALDKLVDNVQMVDAAPTKAGELDAQQKQNVVPEATPTTANNNVVTAVAAQTRSPLADVTAVPVTTEVKPSVAMDSTVTQGHSTDTDSSAAKSLIQPRNTKAEGLADVSRNQRQGETITKPTVDTQPASQQTVAVKPSASADAVSNTAQVTTQSTSYSEDTERGFGQQSDNSASQQKERDTFSSSFGVGKLSTAAGVQAASQLDNTRPGDRVTAMMRSTSMSPDDQTVVDSVQSKPTLGGRREVSAGEAEPSTRAEGTQDVVAGPSPSKDSTTSTVQTSSNVSHTTTSERVHVAEQISRKIDSLHMSHGTQEVTMHLKPDNLGDLHLTVTADKDSITARIVTDTAAAQTAVEAGREDLRSALEQKGLTLQGLDVSLQNGTGNQRFTQFLPNQNSTPGQATSSLTTTQDDPDLIPSISESYNGRNSVGRLDYQA